MSVTAEKPVLVLNAAPAGPAAEATVTLVMPESDHVLAFEMAQGLGAADGIAVMARSVLKGQPAPERIVVATGPGSFTGLRASIALAHGLAFGLDIPLTGVSIGQACAAMTKEHGPWICLSVARRGRVFCEAATGDVSAFAPDRIADQPWPPGTIIHGDAQDIVPSDLAVERGWRLSGILRVDAPALLRAAHIAPVQFAAPLYVDPPEAKLPAAGLRPAPR